MFKGAHLPSVKLTPWPVRHCRQHQRLCNISFLTIVDTLLGLLVPENPSKHQEQLTHCHTLCTTSTMYT
jgi:hypothetical protein